MPIPSVYTYVCVYVCIVCFLSPLLLYNITNLLKKNYTVIFASIVII